MEIRKVQNRSNVHHFLIRKWPFKVLYIRIYIYQEKPKQSSVIFPQINRDHHNPISKYQWRSPQNFCGNPPRKKIFAPRCSIHSNRGTNIWAFSASPETPSGIRPLKTGRSWGYLLIDVFPLKPPNHCGKNTGMVNPILYRSVNLNLTGLSCLW
jgi:hypothetical protein